MSAEKIDIIIDGVEVEAKPEQTIIQAAAAAGIYIPHLCYHEDLPPGGHCRVCTVKVNGKPMSSCTTPAGQGMVIENNTEEINTERRHIIEMLFVEGNHVCPFCEKSGNCELQALAYRLGMIAPGYPYLFPKKELDGSHPDVYLDRNRCILCGRCVRASREMDGKYVFGFKDRGLGMRLAVDAEHNLAETDLKGSDRAADICPTGSLVVKRVGFEMPVGTRLYDRAPIGSEVEKRTCPSQK